MIEHSAQPGASDASHELREFGPLGALAAPQFAIIVFITSEAFFFLTLITTYIVYRSKYLPALGPTPQEHLNVGLTSIFTVFLLSSSVTMGVATSQLGRGNVRAARLWLFVTVALGAVFLVGQGFEYLSLFREGAPINQNLWTSIFFTLTGFHGFHVLIGLIAIVTVASIARAEGPHVRGGVAVETVSLYWHFVDAVWIVIFPVVYLWTLFS
ncbi:MAG TPA: cytochrome c oxidase subunit 3 [Chloroflexota bacterium]|nr:cytochrome c oxidase subunit 3 [Chloroflexota bacterium]